MVKGIPIENNFSDITHLPFFLSDHYLIQIPDTLTKSNTVTSPVLQVTRPKIFDTDSLSPDRQRLERIFQVAEEREKQMSKPKTVKQVVIKEDTTVFEGSTSRIYTDFTPSFQKLPDYNADRLNENFLSNISEKNIHIFYKSKDSSEINKTVHSTVVTTQQKIPTGFEGKGRVIETNGWYILTLLIALSIFAWGKFLYQKYLLQILSSVYNYQISIQLFRDKNVLFRNLSIILQVLFPINVGLLIYYLIDFYNLNHVFNSSIIDIALYSFGVFLFFRLKAFIYRFIGFVFKVQEDFYEIQHHMNIFNQALGVVLVPFVVSLPFLNEGLKIYFLGGLFTFLGIMVLLFFFRGVQIVNRKQVSFFFLILYLCAVEILPVILLIKASYTIV